MKVILGLLVLFSLNVSAKTSCQDPESCLPTAADLESCIDYITSTTPVSSGNDLNDVKRVCELNFGSSCIEYVTEHLGRKDLNSLLDAARACAANYSNKCIKTLLGATLTKNVNTVLDFTVACRQNYGSFCVKEQIDERSQVNHWTLRRYAKNCQIPNRSINRTGSRFNR